jgi:ABC-type thiamine transport system ATPase subunit
MIGVAISGPPSYIYGDNMSVIHNTQRPESMLKKKFNLICHDAICKAVAMGECLTGHVSTHNNPANICTKVIPEGKW